MKPLLRQSKSIWTITTSASVLIGSAWACSGVGPIGKPVVFGDQTNIVIWDEANHVEHFIRNAKFRSGADNFGFIAPTPNKPELSQASNKAFYTLASLAPVVLLKSMARGGFMDRAKSAEVQVLQEADVSGYHATTVKSPDAHAINDWMNQHGYVSTPEVEKWAERYCSRGWCLTAFKVIDKTKLIASTGTVRMSFKADKPYNPFYVPATNIPINGKGTLRVYFVSVGDYEAKIGTTETWQTPQWKAPVSRPTLNLLAQEVKLPAGAIPDHFQVETFVDNNFPRPAAEDIYFTKKVTVTPVESASIRNLPAFAMPTVFVGLGLLAVVRRRRPLP